MSFLDRFRKAPVSRKPMGISTQWDNPTERNERGFLKAYGEIYSLFGISIRIATAVSEVRWRLYRGSERRERNQVRAKHPITTLLNFANDFQTGQDVIELTQLHLDLVGKAFWYLPRNALGVPAEIWVIPPHLMKPVKDDKSFIKGWVCGGGQAGIPFSTSEIIWFSMPDPLNPYGGVGYAEAAALELDTEQYSSKWNRNFFYNSARPDAVLETSEQLDESQYEQLREQWRSRYGGVSKAHKVAILESGLTYKQISNNMKDMDFIQGRKVTRDNLMFTYGMPLPVMGITENVNRANAEAGEYVFARWLVRPRLNRIRNKLNEQLLPMWPMATGLEIDFDEVVPETIEQKKELAESGVRTGYKTINEARAMVGDDLLPPEVGDVLLVPFNLMPHPINQPLQSPTSSPAPAPEVPEEESRSKGMSDAQKEAFWRIYAFKTEQQERKFLTALQSFLSDQASRVVKNYIKLGKVELDLGKEIDEAVKVFTPLVSDTYETAFDDVNEDIGKGIKEASPAAIEWIKTRSLQMGTAINLTTAELLRIDLARGELAAGFAEGEGIPQIERRIRGFFDKTYKGRANNIARTEVIAASNEGALESYKANGILKTEFVVSFDDRLCEECEALSGNIYPVEEAHGIIPVHPSCRCTFVPVI